MKTFLKNLFCCCALSAVFFSAAPCSAEQEEIVKTLDGSTMAIFLSEEGYTRITVLESGNLVVHMPERPVIVSVGLSENTYSLLSAPIRKQELSKAIDTERLNLWNKKQSFTRAYLEEEGPVLEITINAYGGVTKKHIINLIRVFANDLKEFESFLEN